MLWAEGHAKKNFAAVESMLLYQRAVVNYFLGYNRGALTDAECDEQIERIDAAINGIE